MLSDNIRDYRKKSNMSQDELAEKLGVSRQSISLWETGQTQPTIENVIALAKIFNISSDMLLGCSDNINISQDNPPVNKTPEKKRIKRLIITITVAIAVVIGVVILVLSLRRTPVKQSDSGNDTTNNSVTQSDNSAINSTPKESATESSDNVIESAKIPDSENADNDSNHSDVGNKTDVPEDVPFDLFSYCKNFAIEKGRLIGDYCIYQQPSTKYGGYENEYFSISYWGDSNKVEFCLHCPIDQTLSINFYLRMRGGYNKKYEYVSSKYYRDTGESLRCATGYIDPAVFSDRYPLSCDKYEGSFEGQDKFMEESRVGICDLIHCLKEFVKEENMECDFSDFDFVNF